MLTTQTQIVIQRIEAEILSRYNDFLLRRSTYEVLQNSLRYHYFLSCCVALLRFTDATLMAFSVKQGLFLIGAYRWLEGDSSKGGKS